MDYKLGLEYREVAFRPEHVGASELNEAEILELIEALEAFAEPVKVVSQPRPLSPDPDDDMISDIAINGHAEALVTGNVRHFATAAQHFQIPVISPADLLRRMKGKVTHDK
jgi:predicted nucleic acid-binding protein